MDTKPDTSLDVLDAVPDTASNTPGTSADSASAEGTTGQSNGNVSGTTTYDDSKVVERLDGIIKRFDTVDDALKSLSSRDSKAETASTVTIDAAQYDKLTSLASVNTFLSLCAAVLIAFFLGTFLWDLFCRLFGRY